MVLARDLAGIFVGVLISFPFESFYIQVHFLSYFRVLRKDRMISKELAC